MTGSIDLNAIKAGLAAGAGGHESHTNGRTSRLGGYVLVAQEPDQ